MQTHLIQTKRYDRNLNIIYSDKGVNILCPFCHRSFLRKKFEDNTCPYCNTAFSNTSIDTKRNFYLRKINKNKNAVRIEKGRVFANRYFNKKRKEQKNES